ncbi:hypothetical protein V2I01_05420 [Micromonospora sp. BRA006-A]|nr:hypothetical protein [Micromonospora sp. BRA006-A]
MGREGGPARPGRRGPVGPGRRHAQREDPQDRGNVAGLDDPVAARDDRLYVAENERGLRLLAYDLGGLGTPSVLYEAPEQGGRVKDLVTCGERRVCLLETPGSGDDTRVVSATEVRAPGVAGAARRVAGAGR